MQARYIPTSYALKLGVILVSGALLSACGGGDDNPAPANPAPTNPTPTNPTPTNPTPTNPTPTTPAATVAYVTSVNESNQTLTGSSIYACTISADGATFSGCAATGTTLPAGIPTSANVANGKVYVTNFGNSGGSSAPNAVSVCTPDAAGALTCADATANYTPNAPATTIRPYNTAFNTNTAVDGGTDAYVLDASGIFKCTVDATTGLMSACAKDIGGTSFGTPSAMAINGNFAYVTNTSSGAVEQCTINATGALTLCTASTPATGNANGRDIKINNGKAYVVDQNAGKVFMYTIDAASGALGTGMDTGAAADAANTPLARPNAIAFNGTHAYITSRTNGSVTQCTVDATTGMLSACATTGATGPTNAFGIAVK